MYSARSVLIEIVAVIVFAYVWAVHIMPIIENPAPKDQYGQLITPGGQHHSADRSDIIGEH